MKRNERTRQERITAEITCILEHGHHTWLKQFGHNRRTHRKKVDVWQCVRCPARKHVPR